MLIHKYLLKFKCYSLYNIYTYSAYVSALWREITIKCFQCSETTGARNWWSQRGKGTQWKNKEKLRLQNVSEEGFDPSSPPVIVNLDCQLDRIETLRKLVKHTSGCICESISRHDGMCISGLRRDPCWVWAALSIWLGTWKEEKAEGGSKLTQAR